MGGGGRRGKGRTAGSSVLGAGSAGSGFRRYPEYRDSRVEWLGEIPAHWEVAALRYRYEQSLGKMLDTKRITGDHLVPYLRNVDVQWDSINLVDLPSMDILPHEIERYTVRPGDLLVCEGGEAGRCAIWHGELELCGYQKALHRLRPLDGPRDEPRFLYYALVAASRSSSFADGQGSTIAHLTGELLRAHRFPFPPMTEQRAIIDFLDIETAKIDDLVRKKRRLVELLREKREVLISRAVSAGLDPAAATKETGIKWLGAIPAHWELAELGRTGDFRKGRGGTKLDERDTGIPCVRYGDLYSHHDHFVHRARSCVTPEVVGDYTSLRYGDVLFAASGETIDDIGKSAVNLLRSEAVCGGDIILFRSQRDCVPEFMGYAVDSSHAAYQKATMGRGFTVAHIYISQLRHLQIPLPPPREQRMIADHLDRETRKLDALIEKIGCVIDRLLEYRSAMISAAVTGTIDVQQATVP